MTRFRSVFPLLLAAAVARGARAGGASGGLRPGGRSPGDDGAPARRRGEHPAARSRTRVSFLGFTGHQILLSGLLVCVLGLLFGLYSYTAVKKLPVHRSMAEVSELIYETCKAYMVQQGQFLLILFGFIGTVIVVYFLLTGLELPKIADHPAVQPHRHGGQLRRGLVRHPDQHARQLADGLRQPARARPGRCATSRSAPA